MFLTVFGNAGSGSSGWQEFHTLPFLLSKHRVYAVTWRNIEDPDRISAELKARSHAASQVTLKLWLGVPVSPFPFLKLRGQASRAARLSLILVRILSQRTAPNPGPVWHIGVGKGLENPCRLD